MSLGMGVFISTGDMRQVNLKVPSSCAVLDVPSLGPWFCVAQFGFLRPAFLCSKRSVVLSHLSSPFGWSLTSLCGGCRSGKSGVKATLCQPHARDELSPECFPQPQCLSAEKGSGPLCGWLTQYMSGLSDSKEKVTGLASRLWELCSASG